MKISTKGRYALRVMVDLALHNNGEFVALKDIAARQDIATKYMEQIVTVLSKAGLVESMRGSNGGHRLSKAPSQYKVGDILRVMEGSLQSVMCSADSDGVSCPMAEGCSTARFWKGLDDVINDYIDSYTLEDLLD